MNSAKPFDISKHKVWEAYKRVKANKGAAGVDDITMKDFEENLKGNLYKIWNRMSSGSYIPPAVRIVEIPKATGGMRQLGVPTVADRVAQMVAKIYLEPKVEPHFHQDSYGYRPNKSALDAVGIARQRCWRNDWVVDLDIKGFFDNLDHELVMRAVHKHTDEKWLHLYIERWLKAPAEKQDGTLIAREKGTPQGGVISPLLANLFMHYAFDKWMTRNFPNNLFERYADDAIVHCKSLQEASAIQEAIAARMLECGLELHPQKTKVVYCKDDDRPEKHDNVQFDFLGYTFTARKVKTRSGKYFTGFNPAISNKAAKAIRQKIRRWSIQRWTTKDIFEISKMFKAVIRGWVNYYGKYYKSKLYSVLRHVDQMLMKWALKKYRKLKGSRRKAYALLTSIARNNPNLFPHWRHSY